jgi:hypothetical protein
MPEKRRNARRRRRRKDMFTSSQKSQLLTGHGFRDDCFGGGFGAKLVRGTAAWCEAAGAWDVLRPHLLREWIDAPPRPGGHGGPGTRPWGFWEFDAKEMRRCTSGVHPFDDPGRQAAVEERALQWPSFKVDAYKLYYGAPGCFFYRPLDFEAKYEHEYAYIDRLDLWLPGELEAGLPLLAADIADLKAEYASGYSEPSTADLDDLRELERDLERLTAKAAKS